MIVRSALPVLYNAQQVSAKMTSSNRNDQGSSSRMGDFGARKVPHTTANRMGAPKPNRIFIKLLLPVWKPQYPKMTRIQSSSRNRSPILITLRSSMSSPFENLTKSSYLTRKTAGAIRSHKNFAKSGSIKDSPMEKRKMVGAMRFLITARRIAAGFRSAFTRRRL